MATINTILVKTRDSSLSSPDTDAANSDVKIGEFALNAKTGKLWVGTKLGDTNGSAYPGGSSDEAMWVGAQILDQNDMSSNSDTKLATQQSIKAYVDSSVLAYDIDSLTAFSGVPHATNDEFVISDSGTELRADMTMVANGAFALVSGNATIAAGGALSLAADCVDSAEIVDNAIDSEHYTDASIDNAHLADDAVDSDELAGGAVDIAHMSASGTTNSSTFLRGDNTWAAPSSGAVTAINNATQYELTTIGSTTTELDAHSGLTYNGTLLTISDASGSDALLKLKSTDAGAGDAPRLKLERDSSSPATNDEVGRMIFTANQADGTMKDYAGIAAVIADKTNSSHDGLLNLEVAVNATTTIVAQVDAGGLNLASGYDYEINGTNVLTATTLGGAVVNSSLTAVGTIATGVWQGTAIASSYIAGDAITGGKIADDTINSEHYVAASIDLEHMSDNSVDSDQYVNGSVDNVHLANDGITISTTDTSLGGTVTFPTMSNVDMGGNYTIGNQSNDVCTFGGGVTITGDLIVSGDTTTVNTATITVEDPLIKLASGNSGADTVDIGFYGLYDNTGSQDVYTGLTRDASDDKWYLWKLNQAEPTTVVNHSGTGFAKDTLVANIEGAVTGDLTGTASLATVTDSTANTDFPVVFNNESDALLDDTAAFEYNPSTGVMTVTKIAAWEATGAINFDSENMTNVDINSGTIDGVTIGAASAGAGTFGTLTCTTLVPTTLGSALDGNGMAITNINVDSGFIDNTPVGASTASSGAFTTLSSTGNTTLGDAVTDTITFTGRIVSGGDLVPIADSTSDLGTTALRFQEIFVDAVTGATISGGTY